MHPTVSDLMTEDVYSVRENDDLESVYDLMESMRIRQVPVVTPANELVGMVSQRNLLQSGLFPLDAPPMSEIVEGLRQMTVGQVMERDVDAVYADTPLEEAGLTLLENHLGCLPVVDNRRLIGILTEADFVRYTVDGLRETKGLLFRRSA